MAKTIRENNSLSLLLLHLSNQNLSLYLPIIKILCVNLEWIKSFNFRVLFWGGPCTLVRPKFTFFICIYPKNITYLP